MTEAEIIEVEVERLKAVMRMLVDNGDMTPTAARQIKLTLGIEKATYDVGEMTT